MAGQRECHKETFYSTHALRYRITGRRIGLLPGVDLFGSTRRQLVETEQELPQAA